MRLDALRVLLTGATGGIGQAIARRLLEEGAHVLLVARGEKALVTMIHALSFAHDRVGYVVADITRQSDRNSLVAAARRWHGGIDMLVNNAGLNKFSMFEQLSAEQLEQTMAVNVLAPMQLCRELLPWLRSRETAAIVNVGSVFGSIGFPGYAAYSASKFAMRGFTEALRRELADSEVLVKYFAPRATRTAMNSAAVEEMNTRLKVTMDLPGRVAREFIALLKQRKNSAVVGWPEKAFVKVNALLPGLVDRALRAQLPVVREFAQASIPQEVCSK